MLRRANHRQMASTNRCANTIRMPSTPSGDRARLSSSTTTGPQYHSTWATPLCLPRAPSGASSAISVQDAGTSAPTARPAMMYPAISIPDDVAKMMNSRPNA